jgi:hypothetical protein
VANSSLDSGAIASPAFVTARVAVGALLRRFGPLVDAEYLAGKTAFRDELVTRFELSEVQAEDLCDELERAELIRFLSTPEGIGWHVHPDPEAGDPTDFRFTEP